MQNRDFSITLENKQKIVQKLALKIDQALKKIASKRHFERRCSQKSPKNAQQRLKKRPRGQHEPHMPQTKRPNRGYRSNLQITEIKKIEGTDQPSRLAGILKISDFPLGKINIFTKSQFSPSMFEGVGNELNNNGLGGRKGFKNQ